MRIDDLHAVRDTDLVADVCIIGSGPAGLTLATELAHSSLRVLVLESGGLEPTPENDDLDDIENVGAARAQPYSNARNRILGGSSHTWSGRCAPLDDLDFAARPWVPFSGWPIGFAEVKPYLDRAAAHLGLGYGSEFTGDRFWELADRNPPRPEVDRRWLRPYFWQISKDPADPFDAKRFGAHAAEISADNVRIVVNATVFHIDTDVDGTHVEALRVLDSSGTERLVRATRIVLATGGIENARLLLASNRIVPGGVGNRHDTVGRYLLDHRCGVVGALDPRTSAAARDRFGKYVVKTRGGKHTFLHGLALSPEIQAEEGLLNCALWIQEVPSEDDPWESVKNLLRGHLTMHDARTVASHPGLLLSGAKRRLIDNAGLPRKLEHVELRCMVEQTPDPNSRITLSDKTDHLGMPRPRIDWKVSAQEDRTVRRAAALVADEFARLGHTSPALREWVRGTSDLTAALTDWAHPTGSTRMSADPHTGVVDGDCRVHGMDNLYIAGSSVFPTNGHANPTLTIVALAVRLADRLRR
ncbi:GMC family oxidoreductase [Nocardia sp. CDC160]|uniref:GMC family oxidoreductase n=1 Tax=Nocardia sp. CDC160 TaxID=3112166 RepID=UPI002DBBFDB9|nr:GMC family oxidoreductase [Nocardia sp. CDC160]MEC3920608.1 GMC family oxidoreductase [Nocardia sp. CDC160]